MLCFVAWGRAARQFVNHKWAAKPFADQLRQLMSGKEPNCFALQSCFRGLSTLRISYIRNISHRRKPPFLRNCF